MVISGFNIPANVTGEQGLYPSFFLPGQVLSWEQLENIFLNFLRMVMVCNRQQWLSWGSHSYQIISHIRSSEKLDLTSFLLKYPKRLKMQVKKLSCQISLRTFSGIKSNVQDRGVSWPVSMLKAATTSFMASWADVDNDFSVTLPNSLFLPWQRISRGQKDWIACFMHSFSYYDYFQCLPPWRGPARAGGRLKTFENALFPKDSKK